jgi:hypothetical protein
LKRELTDVDITDGGLLVVLVQLQQVLVGDTLQGLGLLGGGFKLSLSNEITRKTARKNKSCNNEWKMT